MKTLFIIMCALALGLFQACSTTTSDLRVYLDGPKQSQISSSALFVDSSKLITSSQEGGGLYKLHHSIEEVRQLVVNVASKFGFESVDREQATYVAELLFAYPDGGACEDLGDVAGSGASYTASVLTFGIVPAHMSHCYLIELALYERIGGELLLVGEFFANQGKVDIYAGAKEIDSYGLVVTKRDEALGMETSIAALFKQMVDDGAFE